jgi:putative ABC transport system permease protein
VSAGEESGGGGLAAKWVKLLLALYPEWFRERYEPEMLETFHARRREAAERGPLASAGLHIRTTANLIASALRMRGEAQHPRVGTLLRQAPVAAPAGGQKGGSMDRLKQDLRFAFRYLRRSPLYTLTVLTTLALGIGMNTATFSVLYGVLFRPLAYDAPSELVQVGRTHPSIPGVLLPLSPANYLDLRASVSRVERLEAETPRTHVLTERGDAGRYPGAAVTAGLFELLGVAPALGRTFREGEDQPGAEAVVVLSDGFWRTQLGGDPSVVGTTIRLNDSPHTVIGVMPEAFQFVRAQLWVPFVFDSIARETRGRNFLRMYARLTPGTTVEQATQELSGVWARLRADFPVGNEDTDFAAQGLLDVVGSPSRTPLYILTGAAGFLLLIACANVANLSLVRAEQRQREVGVRAALGAAPTRIARQFLTESVVLAVIGGAIGVWFAHLGLKALLATFGSAVPRSQEIGVNGAVLAFTVAASLLTGLLVGLVPAMRARPDFDMLREGSRGGTARLTLLGRALIVGEVALALMLVTGAGLLLKSYDRATRSELGFRADEIVAANLWFPPSRYADGAATQAFVDQLMARMEARPEIETVALSSMVPIREFGNNWTEIGVVGRENAKASFVENRNTTPGFFETLGIELLRGRLPTDAEARDGATVVLLNRTLARQLFGDDDPLGHRLDLGGSAEPEIIGVVSDLREAGPDQTARPTMYWPTSLASNLIVRTTADAGTVAGIIRAAAGELDPSVPLVRVQHMDEIIDTALSNRRFQLTLLGILAATALALACVGIYGVLSYTVSRQTREIGVRMALGARAGGVAKLVLWRGGRLAIAGVLLGLAGAAGVRRVIESQLFEVGSFDPVVYAGVSVLLLVVAAAACLIPARRAATVEPTQALRTE